MDFASLDDKTLSSLSNKVQSILSKDSYQDDKASKSDRRFVEPRLSTEKSRPGKGKRTGSGRSRLPNDNVTTSTSSKPAGVGSQSLRLMSQSKGQRQKQPHLRMTPGNANPKAVQQGREGVRASTKRLKRPGATFEATERPIPYSRSTKSIAKSKPHERQQQTMPVTSDRSSMISFHDRPDWFNAPLPVIAPDDRPDISQATISKLFAHSKELLRQENQRYANSKSSSSSHKFYSTIMSSGTLSDKVSALTLSIQESPLHNMHALETLVGLAKKRSRSQAVQVLGALKDLFSAGSVLPVDRKLCAFAAQPSLTAVPEASMKAWGELQPLPSPLQEAHLIYWAFEDWLKATYFDVVKLLEVWCNDEIVYSRLKAVDYTYELLREKPEQEANLLRLLVNKMGDPEKRVASKASSNLVQLQLPHPFMKPNIISTIESDVLFKPGQSLHAKYYAVITLNQTVLQGHQQEVVVKILEIYFALFLSLLESQQSHATIRAKQEELNVKPGRKGLRVNEGTAKRFKSSRNPQAHDAELTDKIVSAILTGINRAFPFASAKDDFFEKHLDILFKITHSSNFNTSLQALMLLQQLSSFHTPASDRFYRTLYESLLDPRLLTTSKQTLYINLLFRAMKADPDPRRVQAFVKRISQIVAMHQPSFVCAAIYLVKELAIAFPSLHTLLDQAETDGSDGEDGITDTSEEAVGNATKNVGQHQAAHYDGRKRDPQFSNAEKSCLWEMVCRPPLSQVDLLIYLRILCFVTFTPRSQCSLKSFLPARTVSIPDQTFQCTRLWVSWIASYTRIPERARVVFVVLLLCNPSQRQRLGRMYWFQRTTMSAGSPPRSIVWPHNPVKPTKHSLMRSFSTSTSKPKPQVKMERQKRQPKNANGPPRVQKTRKTSKLRKKISGKRWSSQDQSSKQTRIAGLIWRVI